jgi:hypothetical protein
MHGSFTARKVFTHWHILDSCGSYNSDKKTHCTIKYTEMVKAYDIVG